MAKRGKIGNEDLDYVQQEPAPKVLKKSYKATGQDLEGTNRSWLDDRSKRIWELHDAGYKPKMISETLNTEAKLKKGQGCTGKEISDWIRYWKKSRARATRPVSLQNNNLRAENTDSCMSRSLYSSFSSHS
jgi:hypothetical protein